MSPIIKIRSASGGIASEPSLLAWYRGDAGVTGTSSVIRWADQSGNGNDLTILDANAGPDASSVTLNGLPVLDFDNTNTEYLSNNALSTAPAEWSMVCVARVNSDTGVMMSSRSSVAGTGGSGTRWDWRMAGGNRQLKFFVNSAESTANSTGDSPTWITHTVSLANGDCKSWIDGVVEDPGSSIIPNPLTDINVGVFHDETLPCDATFAEIAFFSEAISNAKRLIFEAEVNARWGL